MTGEARTASAESLDQIAAELERAVQHARIAAAHFRQRETPRACAHTLALQGHLAKVRGQLDELSIRHADHAYVT